VTFIRFLHFFSLSIILNMIILQLMSSSESSSQKSMIICSMTLLGHYQKHALFCYYAIKRQISTKLIGENMFCMKAHQLSIGLPSNSRLVLLRIYTSYTKTCCFLGVTCYFSRMTYFWLFVLFRCYDFIRSLYYF
jgi:hypothetical protein